jgi:hypothetical protein
MEKLFTMIPFTVAIGILVMAFGAKADSDNPIFGNDINASFVADLAVSETAAPVDPDSTRPAAENEHRPESTSNDRESSDIVQLPDIIVRPDPIEAELAWESEAKTRAREEMSSRLAALPVVDRGNNS